MSHLTRITIYPIKSLDGVEIQEARVLPSGALEHDRQFAIFDAQGTVVNGKRTPLVHAIHEPIDLTPTGRQATHDQLSVIFGHSVTLAEAPETGFPDDTDAPGPTIVSDASLREVVRWFPDLTLDAVRQRFRANLEVAGVEPFWEDRLFDEAAKVVQFRIGEVTFEGTNPCQRCVVPSRSPTTGEVIPGFAKTFAGLRRATLPAWANLARFDHFYRFVVNTRLCNNSGGMIRVGDPIEIFGAVARSN